MHPSGLKFPTRSLYMGIDIMLSPCGQFVFVLEVNAFGDLLKGFDSYTPEIVAAMNQIQSIKESKRKTD